MEKLCTVEGCANKFSCKGYCNKHYLRFRKYGTPTPARPSFEDRFWEKVEKTEECWNWKAGKLATGYGSFDGSKKAHRVSYELRHGAIPEGMHIDHICHNILCVNPDHLRPVTHKQNVENFGKMNRANSSGFRGVTLHKASGLWMATVRHNNKRITTYHKTKEEAGEVARLRRLELHTHNDRDRVAA